MRQIELWKRPATEGLFSSVGKVFAWPVEQAESFVMSIPGIDELVRRTTTSLVTLLNSAAQWSVRPDLIHVEYRKAGYQVRSAADIYELDLEDVDRVIGLLGAKYISLSTVEGAGTGAMGLVGVPVDIVALTTLTLRAIGEYATYCGFDVQKEQERAFAVQVLGLASSPTDASKQIAIASLARIAGQAVKRRPWEELEKNLFVRMVQQVAKALGIRLTKAKLAQIIPAAGAVVGGGFNAFLTKRVCAAADILYRERFLQAKYGEHFH